MPLRCPTAASLLLLALAAPSAAESSASEAAVPEALAADDACASEGSDREPACALNALQQRGQQLVEAAASAQAEHVPAEELAVPVGTRAEEQALLEVSSVGGQDCFKCDTGCVLNYMNPPVMKKCPRAQPYYVLSHDYCVNTCQSQPHYVPQPQPHYVPQPQPHYVPQPQPHTTQKPSAHTTTRHSAQHGPTPAPPHTSSTCPVETEGTCRFFGCHASRGKTKCVKGKCLCEAGHCADKNKKLCLPAMPHHR
mmetsp:Transcript_127121/g.353958  ORF Transcript_127121/g.353958 Transcript_127121/m.353958 type:complete len:253 (-) Transcript_127121:140-898(-)